MRLHNKASMLKGRVKGGLLNYRLSIGVFFLTLALCSLLTCYTIVNRSNMENITMSQLIHLKSTNMRETLSRMIYKTEALAALARQGVVSEEDFDLIASSIVDDPSVLYVMLAPGGVVSNVYPNEDYESRIGLDILKDGIGASDAVMAKESGHLLLGGPYELRDGGQALLVRLPVYTETGDGQKSFWGLVSVALRYPDVLQRAGLQELLLQGFAYEIWAKNTQDGSMQLIDSSDYELSSHVNYIEETISILNAKWIFRVLSLRAWYEYTEMWILLGISVCISFLVAFLQVMMTRAKNASNAKSDFLASVSHEIRTPMNAIIGMSELLMSESLNQRQHDFVKEINVSSTALLGIINDILDMSKIEAGKLDLAPVHFELPLFIENISSVMTFAAKNKGLSFILDEREPIPRYVHGDDIRLRQILINLLGNAVKFTENGFVKLSAGYDEGVCEFIVSDSGIGIRQEDIERLYDSFEQFDTTRNREKQGTGLGLSITKSLIDMMGGSIHISSVYGQGTSFTVKIPLPIGDEALSGNYSEDFEFISARDAKVLLVDDNEANRNVGRGLLALSDIECDMAVDGLEAVDMILKEDYDLVFMDHMMPRLDGLEATQMIRDMGGKYKELVIIALTANAAGDAREMFISAGMNDFLAKPVNKAVLNQMLKKWLPEEKQMTKVKAVGASGGFDGEVPSGFDGEVPSGSDNGAVDARTSRIIDSASKISGLDVKLGLSHVGTAGDYVRSLRILNSSIPSDAKRLSSLLEAGEAGEFAIVVHGIKGALAINGHESLSKMALELETASKEGDIGFCESRLPEFLQSLSLFADSLGGLFEENPDCEKQQGDIMALREAICEVEGYVSCFDRQHALEVIERFSGYTFGEETDGSIGKLRGALEEFDYDAALDAISGMKL